MAPALASKPPTSSAQSSPSAQPGSDAPIAPPGSLSPRSQQNPALQPDVAPRLPSPVDVVSGGPRSAGLHKAPSLTGRTRTPRPIFPARRQERPHTAVPRVVAPPNTKPAFGAALPPAPPAVAVLAGGLDPNAAHPVLSVHRANLPPAQPAEREEPAAPRRGRGRPRGSKKLPKSNAPASPSVIAPPRVVAPAPVAVSVVPVRPAVAGSAFPVPPKGPAFRAPFGQPAAVPANPPVPFAGRLPAPLPGPPLARHLTPQAPLGRSRVVSNYATPQPVPSAVQIPVAAVGAQAMPKRGRGRPKGSKNRSKLSLPPSRPFAALPRTRPGNGISSRLGVEKVISRPGLPRCQAALPGGKGLCMSPFLTKAGLCPSHTRIRARSVFQTKPLSREKVSRPANTAPATVLGSGNAFATGAGSLVIRNLSPASPRSPHASPVQASGQGGVSFAAPIRTAARGNVPAIAPGKIQPTEPSLQVLRTNSVESPKATGTCAVAATSISRAPIVPASTPFARPAGNARVRALSSVQAGSSIIAAASTNPAVPVPHNNVAVKQVVTQAAVDSAVKSVPASALFAVNKAPQAPSALQARTFSSGAAHAPPAVAARASPALARYTVPQTIPQPALQTIVKPSVSSVNGKHGVPGLGNSRAAHAGGMGSCQAESTRLTSTARAAAVPMQPRVLTPVTSMTRTPVPAYSSSSKSAAALSAANAAIYSRKSMTPGTGSTRNIAISAVLSASEGQVAQKSSTQSLQKSPVAPAEAAAGTVPTQARVPGRPLRARNVVKRFGYDDPLDAPKQRTPKTKATPPAKTQSAPAAATKVRSPGTQTSQVASPYALQAAKAAAARIMLESRAAAAAKGSGDMSTKVAGAESLSRAPTPDALHAARVAADRIRAESAQPALSTPPGQASTTRLWGGQRTQRGRSRTPPQPKPVVPEPVDPTLRNSNMCGFEISPGNLCTNANTSRFVRCALHMTVSIDASGALRTPTQAIDPKVALARGGESAPVPTDAGKAPVQEHRSEIVDGPVAPSRNGYNGQSSLKTGVEDSAVVASSSAPPSAVNARNGANALESSPSSPVVPDGPPSRKNVFRTAGQRLIRRKRGFSQLSPAEAPKISSENEEKDAKATSATPMGVSDGPAGKRVRLGGKAEPKQDKSIADEQQLIARGPRSSDDSLTNDGEDHDEETATLVGRLRNNAVSSLIRVLDFLTGNPPQPDTA